MKHFQKPISEEKKPLHVDMHILRHLDARSELHGTDNFIMNKANLILGFADVMT